MSFFFVTKLPSEKPGHPVEMADRNMSLTRPCAITMNVMKTVTYKSIKNIKTCNVCLSQCASVSANFASLSFRLCG